MFAEVDHIIHAGDVCGDDVLVLLESIAPVTAVRGNMDTLGQGARLPSRAVVTIDGARIVIQHGPFGAHPDPAIGAADILVYGHTHRPLVRSHGGMLVVNPGSPASNRDRSEGTVVLMTTGVEPVSAAIIPLAR